MNKATPKTVICRQCNQAFTYIASRPNGRVRSFCPKCVEEKKREHNRKGYLRKNGIEYTPAKISTVKAPPKVHKTYCPVPHCRFKSGNRPCVFMIQDTKGNLHCPNINEFNLYARSE